MPEKHKRNVPIAKSQDTKDDRERQQSADADVWRAKYGITKRCLADAIKAVGSLRAKKRTGSKHE